MQRAGTSDVIDAALVLLAVDGDEIVTSAAADLKPLAALTGQHVELVQVLSPASLAIANTRISTPFLVVAHHGTDVATPTAGRIQENVLAHARQRAFVNTRAGEVMRILRRISGAVVLALAACGGGDAGSADSRATERDSRDTTQASEPSATSAAPPAAASAAPVAAEAGWAGRGVCSLATEAEVTEIMGQPMKFGEGAQAEECLLVASSGDPNVSVTFQVHRTTAMYDQLSTAGGAEQVSGVGDRAVVHTIGASSLIAAVKGGAGYLGRVYDSAKQGGTKQQAVEVARKVVGRM